MVDCVTCHPEESALHASSAHANSLQSYAGSAFATHLSGRPLGESKDGFVFGYSGSQVTAARGENRMSANIAWIFGSGRQGQTPILQTWGHFIEHRVSYYVSTGYGITIGQKNGASPNAETALGRTLSSEDAHACFACHATVDRGVTSITPGIACVRCHAGAEKHSLGQGLPVNPGKIDHKAQVFICGECHRLKPPSGNEDDIGNVRFQPLRLMKSACFRKSDIACTTCHAAHRDASHEGYNQRCLGCHMNASTHTAKLNNTNCVECHMPKATPAPGLTFTDHYIRIRFR
jgi:hypothetical protein